MDLVDVFLWLMEQPTIQKAIETDGNTTGSNLQKSFTRRNISLPFTSKHASALLIAERATEASVQFRRSYGSGTPSVKTTRMEKRQYIQNMPQLYILRKDCSDCEFIDSLRMRDNIENSRDIICARMSLKDTIKAKLLECKSTGSWPIPPVLRVIQPENVLNTVVVLLSIDLGAGTVKFMGRFLREHGTQKPKEFFF